MHSSVESPDNNLDLQAGGSMRKNFRADPTFLQQLKKQIAPTKVLISITMIGNYKMHPD